MSAPARLATREAIKDDAYLRTVFEWKGACPSIGLVGLVLQELRDIGEVAADVRRERNVFANPVPDDSQALPRVVRMTMASRLELLLALGGDALSTAAVVTLIEWVFGVKVGPMTKREELSSEIATVQRAFPRLLNEYSRIRGRSLPVAPHGELRVVEVQLLDVAG